MPRNVEAEAALLGAMMIDNRIADDVGERLDASHFYEPLHGRIFTAIVGLRSKDQVATPVTLRPMFEADAAMQELGGVRYLAGLTGSGAGLIGARQFAQQIYDLAMLRALVAVGRTLVDRAMDTSEEVNPRVQVEAAEQALAEVTATVAVGSRTISFAEAWDAGMSHVEALANGTATRGIQVKRVGQWNDALGGMAGGDMILLAGRPGSGKTNVALAVAQGAAEAGHGVLFISREMKVSALIPRIIADRLFEAGSRATFEDVLTGKLTSADRQIAITTRERLAELPLHFEEALTLNAARVPHIIRQAKRRLERRGVKLGLVVVDYLQLLEPPRQFGTREQEIGAISRGLKAAALATDTALLALSQLSRAVEQREDKRPMLSDLRDSGSLEQDADAAVFAYREEYYLRQSRPDEREADKYAAWQERMDSARNRLELNALKVRQGEAGRRQHLLFFGDRQAIRGDEWQRVGGMPG